MSLNSGFYIPSRRSRSRSGVVGRLLLLILGIVLGVGGSYGYSYAKAHHMGPWSNSTPQNAAAYTPSVGTPAGDDAPNPVAILRKIPGCKLSPGTAVGTHDLEGDRMAECNFMDNSGSDGTDITIYTWSTREGAMPGITDDTHKDIVGPHFDLMILGDWSSYSAHVNPAKVAAEVGGTLRK